jgi:hypothetical protein
VRSLDSYVELQIAQSFHVGWIHRSPGSAPCLRTASPSGPSCHSGIGFPPVIEAFRAKFCQADCFLFDRQYVLLRFSPSLLPCSSFVPDLLPARTNRKGLHATICSYCYGWLTDHITLREMRSLPSVTYFAECISLDTRQRGRFAECRTRQRNTHRKSVVCRVPNTRQS